MKITSLLNPACGNPTLFPGANGCDPNGDPSNLSNSSSSLLFNSDPIRNGVATPIKKHPFLVSIIYRIGILNVPNVNKISPNAQCLKITQNVAFEFSILAFSTNVLSYQK